MSNNTKLIACAAIALSASVAAFAQDGDDWKKVTVNGSVMSDIMVAQPDDNIGTDVTNTHLLTNTYADVSAMSKYVDAGIRFAFLEKPLPGFEPDFKGWGLPYYYLKLKFNEKYNLTLGHFYDQFGSGFIFRTYENRQLGIDNSIHGAHFAAKPFKGVDFRALTGKQHRYWDLNSSWVTGANLELGLQEWIPAMQQHNTYLTIGGSWVNKHEKEEEIMADPTHRLNLPENVNAFDVRANLQAGNFNVLAEYAWKTDNPSFRNGYIYRPGNVAMLSASWSKSGISALVQAKRSVNMDFRSERSEVGIGSSLNHLPAFTMDQTYALATIYPYSTNANGEWAYQAEFGYNFKRKTLLGGKYGTSLKLNFSYIRAIEQTPVDGGGKGTDGYESSFWKWGDDTYYRDFNVQIDKRVTKDLKLNFMYLNQYYNQTAVEGHGGIVKANIFIGEAKYRFNNKYTLRGEAQFLTTHQDQGNWWFGLLELSVLPHWMFTVSDQYNVGETNLHYYQGYVTFNAHSHRFQLGFGRTRAGFNCSGGVCRYVPASKGFTLSYNYNF